MGKKLTGKDYVDLPLPYLTLHPDFSQHAFRVVIAVLDMSTEELEKLDVAKFGGVRA